VIGGVVEKPAAIGEAICTERCGPIWKLGGETCGCVLPASHLDDPLSDHECSCGAWWVRPTSPETGETPA